jgi:hypothetical protein
MYDEATLRKLAAWEPLAPSSEASALAAAKALVGAVRPDIGIKAFVHEGAYENFVAAYVYLPANVVRSPGQDGQILSCHESLVLYFSHLVPLAALGRGVWDESKDSSGRVWAWGYSGLDTPKLLAIGDLEDGPMKDQLSRAIKASGYSVMPPADLLAPAPSWFEPLQRSEGALPWDRMFHLLFQFCD